MLKNIYDKLLNYPKFITIFFILILALSFYHAKDFKLEIDDTNQVVITNPPMVKVDAKAQGNTTTETTK